MVQKLPVRPGSIKFLRIENNAAEIKKISAFAYKIVKEFFDPIIGVEENAHMLSIFQSEEGIKDQLEHGYQYYYVCDKEDNKLGFISIQKRENEMYISKFFLDKQFRGKGYANAMLDFVKKEAKVQALSVISLRVNKQNIAREAYEAMGFKITQSIKQAVGKGFYMNDYEMKCKI